MHPLKQHACIHLLHALTIALTTSQPQGKGAAATLEQAAAPGAAELEALEASSSSDDDTPPASDSDADSEERMRCVMAWRHDRHATMHGLKGPSCLCCRAW